MGAPAEGLERLRDAARAGELGAFCARHRIRVRTVFGSVARADSAPRDLDVGVMFEPDVDVDHIVLIRDLTLLTGTDIDVACLDRAGPLIRERALVGSVPLYESEPGALARAATAAAMERMDTDWMRRGSAAAR